MDQIDDHHNRCFYSEKVNCPLRTLEKKGIRTKTIKYDTWSYNIIYLQYYQIYIDMWSYNLNYLQ